MDMCHVVIKGDPAPRIIRRGLDPVMVVDGSTEGNETSGFSG
jgi:hypothetical protein